MSELIRYDAAYRPLASIIVGTRHRQDLGDIKDLAASIAAIGLLHPIVITTDNRLVAGERRLEACRSLGLTEVPVTVVDLKEIVRGELAENAIRKDFLPSEIDAICRALEPIEQAAAKERRTANLPNGKISRLEDQGRARDKVGAFAGVSGRTVAKIKAVVDAAKGNPERFGHLVEQMDRTGKVDPAFSQVNRHKKHKAIAAKAAAQPKLLGHAGPFSLIYADPPWKWGHFGEQDQENEAGKGRTPDQHYRTLTYEEIENFRINGKAIREIAHKDAALFLWCTSSNIALALKVMIAWGFDFKTSAAWDKQKKGMGLVFRNQHELLLYGTRGDMPGPQYQPSSLFSYPRGKHSAKPAAVRSVIEKMYPAFNEATRLEIFAREKAEGWTVYGYEADDAAASGLLDEVA